MEEGQGGKFFLKAKVNLSLKDRENDGQLTGLCAL